MAKDLLFKRSPKEAMKYYYTIKVLEFMLSMVIATVVFFLWSHFNWWHFILYLIITFIVFNILYTLITPWIKYKYAFYRVENKHIEIKYDFFFKSHKIVKLERTQLIERKYNPILSRLGLAKVSLITAGHTVSFPLLTDEEAIVIESKSLSYLRGADYDV